MAEGAIIKHFGRFAKLRSLLRWTYLGIDRKLLEGNMFFESVRESSSYHVGSSSGRNFTDIDIAMFQLDI